MYDWIDRVLRQLKPGFDSANFQVYNCNKNTKLTLFPYMSFEDAIERSTIPDLETTRGWYNTNSSNHKGDKQS